jgi:hypothetical protein
MKFTVQLTQSSFSVAVDKQQGPRGQRHIGTEKLLRLTTEIVKALEAWGDKNKAAVEAQKASEKRCEVKIINLGEITDNETLKMILEGLPPDVFEELMKGARGQ